MGDFAQARAWDAGAALTIPREVYDAKRPREPPSTAPQRGARTGAPARSARSQLHRCNSRQAWGREWGAGVGCAAAGIGGRRAHGRPPRGSGWLQMAPGAPGAARAGRHPVWRALSSASTEQLHRCNRPSAHPVPPTPRRRGRSVAPQQVRLRRSPDRQNRGYLRTAALTRLLRSAIRGGGRRLSIFGASGRGNRKRPDLRRQ